MLFGFLCVPFPWKHFRLKLVRISLLPHACQMVCLPTDVNARCSDDQYWQSWQSVSTESALLTSYTPRAGYAVQTTLSGAKLPSYFSPSLSSLEASVGNVCEDLYYMCS